mmetsp:Transcript_44103/g.93902  ORF Transcript_44103/g.93902 Transcript_44103/m.93902 type:complete len:201 (-) Transcript_44103:430-1032(-)
MRFVSAGFGQDPVSLTEHAETGTGVPKVVEALLQEKKSPCSRSTVGLCRGTGKSLVSSSESMPVSDPSSSSSSWISVARSSRGASACDMSNTLPSTRLDPWVVDSISLARQAATLRSSSRCSAAQSCSAKRRRLSRRASALCCSFWSCASSSLRRPEDSSRDRTSSSIVARAASCCLARTSASLTRAAWRAERSSGRSLP